MGGKPWTSKGCVDCRKRKIKCDEQRPECGRCLKSGLKCQGWEDHRNFIGAPSLREARRIKNTLGANGEAPSDAIAAPPYPQGPNPRGSKLPIVVHSAQAMRAQVFESFIQKFSGEFLPSSSSSFDDPLICNIASLAQKSQMTDRALSAMSCLFLGKADRNTTMFKHGVYLYNSAISHMSNMLRRGTYTKDMIYTVFLFQEIDIIHLPNGITSYGVHIAAMSSLLRYYGSKLADDSIVNTIYRHRQKIRIAFASTGMYLSQAERDILMEPTNGDPVLEILQTTVAIGDLKSFIDSINPNCPDMKGHQAILRNCYEIQDRLVGLYQDGWLGREPHRFQSRDNAVPEVHSPERLFGLAYCFSAPNHAFLFIMFWAHLLLLQPLIRRAIYLVRLDTGSTIGTGIRPALQFEDLALADPEKYADKIARAMPYCLQDCMKQTLTKGAMFTLGMAIVNYVDTGNRAKFEWCMERVRNVGSRGSDISSYLTTVGDALWERRWVAGDPCIYISLRIGQTPGMSDMNTVPLVGTKSDVQDGFMYHSGSPLAVKAITD